MAEYDVLYKVIPATAGGSVALVIVTNFLNRAWRDYWSNRKYSKNGNSKHMTEKNCNREMEHMKEVFDLKTNYLIEKIDELPNKIHAKLNGG